jgi:hypothetical protein
VAACRWKLFGTIQLALRGEVTKPARKEILLDAKKDLEKKIADIQESLDVINYKLDTYEQKCEPITMDMVNAWKEQQH